MGKARERRTGRSQFERVQRRPRRLCDRAGGGAESACFPESQQTVFRSRFSRAKSGGARAAV